MAYLYRAWCLFGVGSAFFPGVQTDNITGIAGIASARTHDTVDAHQVYSPPHASRWQDRFAEPAHWEILKDIEITSLIDNGSTEIRKIPNDHAYMDVFKEMLGTDAPAERGRGSVCKRRYISCSCVHLLTLSKRNSHYHVL